MKKSLRETTIVLNLKFQHVLYIIYIILSFNNFFYKNISTLVIQVVSTNYLMYRFRVPKREYLQLREKGNNNVGIKNLRIIRNECKSMKENIRNTSVKKYG